MKRPGLGAGRRVFIAYLWEPFSGPIAPINVERGKKIRRLLIRLPCRHVRLGTGGCKKKREELINRPLPLVA